MDWNRCCSTLPKLLVAMCLTLASAHAQGVRQATPVYPLDAVVDATGAVWVVDRNAPGVWKFENGALELAIPGAKQFRKPLNASRCIAISPQGTLYVGDPATREVYRREPNGEMTPIMSGIPGTPVDLAVTKEETVYVADVERRVIWRKRIDDAKPEVFAQVNPRGLFVDSQDRLWVISQNKEQLLRIAPDGKQEVLVSDATFEFPHQVVVTSDGTAWISDGYKHGLWKWSEGKKPELVTSGTPLENPVGLFLVDDRPVIVDPHAQAVFKLGPEFKPELWFKVTPK